MEKRLLQTLPSLSGEPECYLVYDAAVEAFAARLLSGGAFRGSLALEVSEQAKTMDSVLTVCRFLLEAGATRKALVVALGGGTLTDMAGFAASIYKRGVRYANIPTTLLAQVDAGIGGKTGVDLDGYKNMLGVIRQPEWVWLCPEVLSTLPLREFRCGVAELLKTFLLSDAALYADAVRFFSGLSSKKAFSEDKSMVLAGLSSKTGVFEDRLRDLIGRAAEIKEGIVERDLYETGERRKLNLGHTFAHAIEHEALRRGDDIRHGEAVAMGVVLAARLSEALGEDSTDKPWNDAPSARGLSAPSAHGLSTPSPHGLSVGSASLAGRLAADFAACGLPVDCPYPIASLVDAMHRDKKGETEGVRFILLRRVGETEERVLQPEVLLELL